jgi:hypothetical protein
MASQRSLSHGWTLAAIFLASFFSQVSALSAVYCSPQNTAQTPASKPPSDYSRAENQLTMCRLEHLPVHRLLLRGLHREICLRHPTRLFMLVFQRGPGRNNLHERLQPRMSRLSGRFVWQREWLVRIPGHDTDADRHGAGYNCSSTHNPGSGQYLRYLRMLYSFI